MAATRVSDDRLIQKLTGDVRELESRLRPDVARIRFSLGEDWSGDPAIFFRIVLSDNASRQPDLGEFTGLIASKIVDELGIGRLDYIPYFNFRAFSEQEKLKSPEWD